MIFTQIVIPGERRRFAFQPASSRRRRRRRTDMAGEESILDAVDEEEALDDHEEEEDIDMLDAEGLPPHSSAHGPSTPSSLPQQPAAVPNGGRNRRNWVKKKKKKRKPRSAGGGVADVNRFVIDTCRHLKERKQYLIWNAVGCLGITAVRELVKEVDAIQDCGGQMTADGKRSRTGGGVMWNILKAREPEAYKEIMAKGRELEKQLWQKSRKQAPGGGNDSISLEVSQTTNNSGNQEVDSPQHTLDAKPKFEENAGESHVSVMNRLRMPVAYDDLFGED